MQKTGFGSHNPPLKRHATPKSFQKINLLPLMALAITRRVLRIGIRASVKTLMPTD